MFNILNQVYNESQRHIQCIYTIYCISQHQRVYRPLLLQKVSSESTPANASPLWERRASASYRYRCTLLGQGVKLTTLTVNTEMCATTWFWCYLVSLYICRCYLLMNNIFKSNIFIERPWEIFFVVLEMEVLGKKIKKIFSFYFSILHKCSWVKK